ncbi:BTB/POZ domain-containing protein KCTD8 [Durusdinium trenchii]
MCIIAVPSQHGLRRYKLEIESTKTVLVDCVKGIPELPAEERSVALQCFTWIFERAYRQMQLRTLGPVPAECDIF